MGVLLHCTEAGPGVGGPWDGGEVGAEGGVARRRQQAPPGGRVSVGAGAEGRVQALRAQAGCEGSARGDAVLSAMLQGGRGGAGQFGGGGGGEGGCGQAQEVWKHQVFFAKESALVVSTCALGSA